MIDHDSSIVLQGEKTKLLKEKQSLEKDLATSWQEYDQAAQVREPRSESHHTKAGLAETQYNVP